MRDPIHPKRQILDLSKLKIITNDNFKIGIDYMNTIQKTFVEKGENGVYQHLLLFPQCSQNFLSQNHKNFSFHSIW